MSALDYWKGRLIKGAISRREFMSRAAALGASGRGSSKVASLPRNLASTAWASATVSVFLAGKLRCAQAAASSAD